MEKLETITVEKPLITEEVMEELEMVSNILNWGTDGSKSLIALYNEIQNGESIIRLDNAGNIVRDISYVGIEVYYVDKYRVFRLYEDRQEFKNGFIRVRNNDIEGVFEKMKTNETPVLAGLRGIKEELGICEEGVYIQMKDKDPEVFPPKSSSSYPGVLSVHTKYSLNAIIGRDYFKPEGYAEKQKDKTTYFKWELVHDF